MLFFIGSAGCGGSDESRTVGHHIVLGAAIDRTGLSATVSWEESIKLAVRHVNAGLLASSDPRFNDMAFTLSVGV